MPSGNAGPAETNDTAEPRTQWAAQRGERSRVRRARMADYGIAGLAVLAPALGGGLEQWSQATVFILAAAIVLLDPPRRWPPVAVMAVAGFLGVVAAAAFLPAAWFPQPVWRLALIPDPDFVLASTLTPQPWRSLQSGLLLVMGAGWVAYLLARERAVSREHLLRFYGIGIGALALVCVIFYVIGYLPSFWDSPTRFGPFANRNQTTQVFGLACLVQLALTFHAFNRAGWSGLVWALLCLLTGLAAIIPGSRGGVLLMFLGAVVWVGWVALGIGRAKPAALGIAGVLAGLSVFMLVGGKTWERLHAALNPEIEAETEERIPTQRDALELWKEVGWKGVGPGNFEAAFARQAVHSLSERHSIHPESDWLWLGIELGWFAPLLVLGLMGLWLRRNWPRPEEPNFQLRSALVVATVAFVVHGFVDVAGHRLGSVWPAIFLLSLIARGSPRGRQKGVPVADRNAEGQAVVKPGWKGLEPVAGGAGVVWAFRGMAVVWLTIGGWWLAAVQGFSVPPTDARIERMRASIRRFVEAKDPRAAEALCTEALKIAPLDVDLYFQRGLVRLRFEPGFQGALADFQRARHFAPNSAALCYAEGLAWLEREPRLALHAWEEALARMRSHHLRGHEAERVLFRNVLNQTQDFPGLRPGLRALVGNDRPLLMMYLGTAGPEEFRAEVNRLLGEDPGLKFLDHKSRMRLFSLWARLGDLELLEAMLQTNTDWMETAWVGLAFARAAARDHAEACALAERHAPKPSIPNFKVNRDSTELRRNFLRATSDWYAGFALYQSCMADGDTEGALVTARRVTAQKGCPPYWHYLEARLEAGRSAWPEAWRAWRRYIEAIEP